MWPKTPPKTKSAPTDALFDTVKSSIPPSKALSTELGFNQEKMRSGMVSVDIDHPNPRLELGRDSSTLGIDSTQPPSLPAFPGKRASTVPSYQGGGVTRKGIFAFAIVTTFISVLSVAFAMAALNSNNQEDSAALNTPLSSDYFLSDAAGSIVAGVESADSQFAFTRTNSAVVSISTCQVDRESGGQVFPTLSCLILTYGTGESFGIGNCQLCQEGQTIRSASMAENINRVRIGFTPGGYLGYVRVDFNAAEDAIETFSLGSDTGLEQNDLYELPINGDAMQFRGLKVFKESSGIVGVQLLVSDLL